MDFPLCFYSKEEFEAWVSSSENDGREDPRLSFCNYCTKRYQDIMKVIGRCENPEHEFKTEEEDDAEWEIQTPLPLT